MDGRDDANLQKKYGLIYTCRAGWIDLGHLNPSNPRIEIGAENLWKQLTHEGPAIVDAACGPAPFMASGLQTLAHHLGKPERCSSDPAYKFPDGKTGFQVVFRQDHAGYPGKPGCEGRYIVKHGLRDDQKRQIALAIFMEVSHRFESFQSALSLVTNSGYSQEDLVSNLIGFYIGIGEIEKLAALRLCHPVSAATAYKIWDREGAVGANKNTQWQPRYASSTVLIDEQQCRDECALVPKGFPDAFTRLQPAIKGSHFYELP
ncbi:MAG: hypothetical protein ABWY06_21675 [Pseudomonas sp.]|uniref:hypothetical protein n=1 Tax=Pseudomonas sp. TaxID=306 RepID=UPI0033954C7C